jgi:lipopolysaccharide/colanic/teichoic acid biosynthesis glycosyltransferase
MIRFFDIIVSVLLIAVTMPVMIITWIAIKLSSWKENPVFIQDRIGRDGQVFRFFKFRSMRTGAADMGHRDYIRQWIKENKPYSHDEKGNPIFKILDDPRVTPVGKLIRRFHIDELPQLFNVLKGDMSLVGPRPAIPYELAHYGEREMKRFSVIPGMTGIWQAEGNKLVSFRDMIDMDLFYIENRSLWLNIKILIKTFFTVMGVRTPWRLVS